MRYLLAALCLVIAGPLLAAVTVDCSYYHVDVGGDYRWGQQVPGLTDFGGRRSGLLKVYLRNSGPEPLNVTILGLNGVPLADLRNAPDHSVIWWRAFPNPIPAGGMSEVAVRLRFPLLQEARLSLRVGTELLEATVSPNSPAFRVDTVSWADGGRELWLVARQLKAAVPRISRVYVDGVDVSAYATIPARAFCRRLSPIRVALPVPLEKGSFHTYKVTANDGTAVACTLRTLDEFMQLGIYGPVELEAAAAVNLNTSTQFSERYQRLPRLDEYLAQGMRNAFYIGSVPRLEVRRHPAIYAYYLLDEPDCADYYVTEWPMGYRIGHSGPALVRKAADCVAVDPVTPTALTLNLTIRPANYYVYSEVADIVAPDCYPLLAEWPMHYLAEVTQAARDAAGPRRVEMIPQVGFTERLNRDMRYPRPPFGREVTIQYLYCLGAGARGFNGWEWFDEVTPSMIHHGAPNYPEVMEAIGETFGRFKLLEPLILQAHPVTLAAASNAKVWTRSLVCGLDAALVVLVNQDYRCLSSAFRINPQSNVRVSVPHLPWLRFGYVAIVGNGELRPLAYSSSAGSIRFTIPSLDAGEVILLAADEQMAEELLERQGR